MTLSPRLSGVILSLLLRPWQPTSTAMAILICFRTNVADYLAMAMEHLTARLLLLIFWAAVFPGGRDFNGDGKLDFAACVPPALPIQPAVYRSFWEMETGLLRNFRG